MFDCERICNQESTLENTKTTTWIWKYLLVSVSIFSNFEEEPIFPNNSDPHHIFPSFIGAPEVLASESRAQMTPLLPISRRQSRLNWAASRKNSPNFVIDGSKWEDLIWIKMIVGTKMCLRSVLTDPKESTNSTSGEFEIICQRIICFWFQRCKIWSVLNQIIFASYSR